MSRRDLDAVAVAAAAWFGAAGPVRPHVLAVALAVVVALARRRPVWVLVAVVVAVGLLAGRAEAGLRPPDPGPFVGEVTLVGDPEVAPGRVRVDVRAGGGRLELEASGGPGGTVRDALAGDRLVVEGRLRSARGDPAHLRSRHVAGALAAERVEPGGPPAPLAAIANGIRDRVAGGAEVLPTASAALLTGLVFGDDRSLPPAEEHDLRAAGLAHLTAVSGQNVALLLVVASPLLGRLELVGRLVVVLGLLGLFVVLTRAEPSVVRASGMALVATAGTTFGRPVAGVRLLALAVAGLVAVDPMLVDALGFRLSVAATAGILLLAGPLAATLPGPGWLTAPCSVTAAAQLGVAPLLVAEGLPVPVVALVANPLAGAAAGMTMAWGLTAGWVAGFLPAAVAEVLHVPSQLATGVVLGVARVAADAPLGDLGPLHLVAVALGGGLLAVARGRATRAAGWAVVAAALVLAAVPRPASPGDHALGPGARVVVAPAGAVLVLDGRADPLRVLDGLRRHGVRRLDLVVVRSPGPRVAATARIVGARVPADEVLVPRGAVAPGRVVGRPEGRSLGGPVLRIAPGATGLDVDVGPEPLR